MLFYISVFRMEYDMFLFEYSVVYLNFYCQLLYFIENLFVFIRLIV